MSSGSKQPSEKGYSSKTESHRSSKEKERFSEHDRHKSSRHRDGMDLDRIYSSSSRHLSHHSSSEMYHKNNDHESRSGRTRPDSRATLKLSSSTNIKYERAHSDTKSVELKKDTSSSSHRHGNATDRKKEAFSEHGSRHSSLQKSVEVTHSNKSFEINGSYRIPKKQNSSKPDSHSTVREEKNTSKTSSTDFSKSKDKYAKKTPSSEYEKRTLSSSHRYEKDSGRQKEAVKRARSPVNPASESRSSSLQRPNEVAHKSNASKTYESKSDRTSKTGNSLRPCDTSKTDVKKQETTHLEKKPLFDLKKETSSSSHRHEKDSEKQKETPKRARVDSGSRHSSSQGPIEVTLKDNTVKVHELRSDRTHSSKPHDTKKLLSSLNADAKHLEKSTTDPKKDKSSSSRFHEMDSEKHKEAVKRARVDSGSSNSSSQRPIEMAQKNNEIDAIETLSHKRMKIEPKKDHDEPLSSKSNVEDVTTSADSSSIQKENPVAINAPKKASSLAELTAAALSRQNLATLLSTPFFDSTVIGCFVRLSQKPTNGNQCTYAVWRIVAVKELNKSYEFDGQQTHKCIKCQRGTEEKLLRLNFVSSKTIQPDELMDWLRLAKINGNVPTVNEIDKKKEEIAKALNNGEQKEKLPKKVKAQSQSRPLQLVPKNVGSLKPKRFAAGDIKKWIETNSKKEIVNDKDHQGESSGGKRKGTTVVTEEMRIINDKLASMKFRLTTRLSALLEKVFDMDPKTLPDCPEFVLDFDITPLIPDWTEVIERNGFGYHFPHAKDGKSADSAVELG